MQADFIRAGTQCTVLFPSQSQDIFLAVPKIQLVDLFVWGDTPHRDIKYLGQTFIDNRNVSNRNRRIYMFMIMDVAEMEPLDTGFNPE